jgi:DNA invertase Pin-like site-specific DNA recombinase
MGRAVIYTRVSSKSQEDGYSLDVQERDGRRYCEGKHEVVAVESDTFSGHDTLEEREGMQRAIRLIRSGQADTLVIWKVDRANRFSLDNQLLLRDVSDAGGSFESVTEGVIPNTPMGKLLLSVHSFAGETEWESIRERTLAGRTARIERGHILPSAVPLYGYHWVGAHKETYEIDEETGPIVQDVYEKADRGWSARRICRWLNEQGILTPSKRLALRGELPGTRQVAEEWTPMAVRDMLKNRSYTGQHAARRYGTTKEKVRLDDGRVVSKIRQHERPEGHERRVALTIPALVSVEQFERVQVLVASRHSERDESADTPLLRGGFAVCGVCGARMVTVQRHDWPVRRYMCIYRGTTCTGHGYAVPVPEVDDDIWARVKYIIRDDERFDRLVQGKSARLAERHEEAVRRAENTAKELDETRAYADVVYKAMMTEKNERMMARHRTELEQLDTNIAGLEKRLAEAQAAVAEVTGERATHAALLAGIAAVVKRYEANAHLFEAYLIERGGDPSKAPELMASMHDAAEEVTLDSLDLETRRGILRLIEAKVTMYPRKSEWARTNDKRWDFQFSPEVHSTRPRTCSSPRCTRSSPPTWAMLS